MSANDSLNAIEPLLTPHGQLRFAARANDKSSAPGPISRIVAAFAQGSGQGLLHLGAAEVATVLPPALAWWRDFAARYVTALCASIGAGVGASIAAGVDASSVANAGAASLAAVSTPNDEILSTLIANAPPMLGAEYLSVPVLQTLWHHINKALSELLASDKLTLAQYLKSQHPAWNLVGRVHFNLAENRKDPQTPFAFLATYTSRLSNQGKAQHVPLASALTEYSGSKNKSQLLSLLVPVQRAAEHCAWLREMVEADELYHPLRWSPAHAFQFLTDVPKLEAAGLVVRAPGAWQAGRPARPTVQGSVGAAPPSLLGMDALLDFQMQVTLAGEPLTAAEVKTLLNGVDGLQWLRGQWVEVDRNKLQRMLARFQTIEQAARDNGVPFAEALRLLSGASVAQSADGDAADWSQLVAGPWLAQTLQGLRDPAGLARVDPGTELKAQLRPYQQAGVRWLYLLNRLRLGACLADDMGLGKTIQVLSLLLVLKRETAHKKLTSIPSVLIAPASLLANWAAEAHRFAPSLRVVIAHPSALPASELQALVAQPMSDIDLLITSYGTLQRLPALTDRAWRLAVIDEAQAIKNPGALQTRQVKKLQAQSRIALTGTPVENRLSDLWSIFDFTHPGLLGTQRVFADFTKKLSQLGQFGPLRTLVQPYILRRLKTDKTVIADLPDKTELTTWCHLSTTQAALYQQAVQALSAALEDAQADTQGIHRKGLVLSYLMRFKQICNHPSQWLGDAAWNAADSGKFARLAELVEVIAAKQEKVLVFTQFRETTEPLAAFLGSLFGRAGLVLHGATAVAKRRELVQRFQDDDNVPFFVLSLKAGGAGLNLTAASHVIHFDRWWNPAVENQATDRAFRIGQKRNVLVHKFVCRGTIEERIDLMMTSKQKLARDVLDGGGAETLLTEMSDRELIDLVKLDIYAAQAA